uniref:Uncharacterized protein n=1 Tax=Zea mays TaxID=4577 RepID=B4FMP0_MAIZE|nr:unknown [Zea mays]
MQDTKRIFGVRPFRSPSRSQLSRVGATYCRFTSCLEFIWLGLDSQC